VSDRSALSRLRRLRGVEPAVALFDPAGPLVPGDGGADMVRASPLAFSGDLLLRLAGCQGKDLIAEIRQAALVAGWFCGGSAPAPSDRIGAAAVVAVVGVFAEAVFFVCVLLL